MFGVSQNPDYQGFCVCQDPDCHVVAGVCRNTDCQGFGVCQNPDCQGFGICQNPDYQGFGVCQNPDC
jgi:hypothetical protein